MARKSSKAQFYNLLIFIALVALFFLRDYWILLVGLSVAIIILRFYIKHQNQMEEERLNKSLDIAEVDYMDGIQFEYYIQKLLINEGYSAIVTKGSNDFGVDIIAVRGNDKYAVQVKRYSGNVSRKAISDAVGGKNIYQCNKAMVVTNSYFTKSAIELAKSNSCILIDRNQLARWIINYQVELIPV